MSFFHRGKAEEGVDLGYESQIPKTLTSLVETFLNVGAIEEKGIFRVEPEEKRRASAIKTLAHGEFYDLHDPNELAYLVKVWFRNRRVKVLDNVEDIKNLPQNGGKFSRGA
eukprot:TRINITY_DN441_c0_g1_i1.p2 TRINITY_DN441_c0_g1~~TRINITY_DN441_c0_g1_i1.p2  ORF type:complete len:111 (+),score=22.64 TRINITY_DN441_c0_g1_i1:601-933(+)